MLQNLKKFYGEKLSTADGDIGHVLDFYFDDQNWTVRYVVVDTGSWLPGRQVLISPHAFSNFHQDGELLPVNLTRRQIEDSPSIESHKPVSRQNEEDYYRYYGWPTYWEGDGLWGTGAFPVLSLPAAPFAGGPVDANPPASQPADTHLRSTLAVDGYHLQASDRMIGHVCNFKMDAQTWAIRQLVIKAGHWLPGKEIDIDTGKVERISYEESTIFVHATGDEIEQSSFCLLAADAKTD